VTIKRRKFKKARRLILFDDFTLGSAVSTQQSHNYEYNNAIAVITIESHQSC